MSTSAGTRADALRQLADDYLTEHGDEPASMDALYLYARSQGWQPPQRTLASVFKEEMRRALQADKYEDPQGRTVRKKHAVVRIIDGKQESLWADVETAPPDHMHLSRQLRRRGILRDVIHVKNDMDSYNENHNPEPSIPVQLSFNFEDDLADGAESTTYDETPPDDDEE